MSDTVCTCPKCGQSDTGQTGEYPCGVCGLPTTHDAIDSHACREALETDAKEDEIAERMVCPRHIPGPWVIDGTYEWRADDTCSYCGSLNPDVVIKLIAEGAKVSPTDKNYKIYINDTQKAYFQHFSPEHCKQLIDLLNEGKINFAFPGYFYVLPYFIKMEAAPCV